MSGFAAYVGADGNDRLEQARRMADRLRHRGPDDCAARSSSTAALAHHHLAIDGERQPLSNADGSTLLVCNGDIHDGEELRATLEPGHRFRKQSDSEVVVHLYEEKGADCVRDLEGDFAFVITAGRRFLAARDALGVKPLYYGRDAETGWWFASELKALPPDCDDIREFPPGHLMTEAGIERWFDPPWLEPPTAPEPLADGDLRSALERAVDKRLVSDVPVGAFLSGGLDSSAIAALMRRSVPELRTFAVGLDGSPDLLAARRAAEHIGAQHHEYVYSAKEAEDAIDSVIEHLESYDPALIESSVACWFASKLASDHVKVVLTGEGADEVFAGYDYFGELATPRAVHAECARLLLGLHNMNLQRVDRMTMAHALEARVPFLDLDFVECAMGLDPALKMTDDEHPEKWILRRAVSDLLPPEIAWRTKQEFSEGSGASTVLTEHAERTVTDADFARRAELFPEDTPTTKQALAYRRIFEEKFPGEARRRTVGRWRAGPPPSA